MLIDESFVDEVMVDAGQYVLSDLSKLSLTMEQFWKIVQRALTLYQRYRPYTWQKNINMQQSFTFQEIYEEVDELDPNAAEPLLLEPIPDFISEIIPVTIGALVGQTVIIPTAFNKDKPDPQLMFPWEYRKPTVYVPYTGVADFTLHANYMIRKTYSESEKLKCVEIVGLDPTDLFMDLVVARFMTVVGRSRRLMQITDIPVEIDSDSLVSEGKELWDASKEELTEASSWHYALGG